MIRSNSKKINLAKIRISIQEYTHQLFLSSKKWKWQLDKWWKLQYWSIDFFRVSSLRGTRGTNSSLIFTRTIRLCIWKNHLFRMSLEKWVILYIGEIAPFTFIFFENLCSYPLRDETRKKSIQQYCNFHHLCGCHFHFFDLSKSWWEHFCIETGIFARLIFFEFHPWGGYGQKFSKKIKVNGAFSPIYRMT